MQRTTHEDIVRLVIAINRWAGSRFFWNNDDGYCLFVRKRSSEDENTVPVIQEKTIGRFRVALNGMLTALKMRGGDNIACPGFADRLRRTWAYGNPKLDGDVLDIYHAETALGENRTVRSVRYDFRSKLLCIRGDYNDRSCTRCLPITPENLVALGSHPNAVSRWMEDADEVLDSARQAWEKARQRENNGTCCQEN